MKPHFFIKKKVKYFNIFLFYEAGMWGFNIFLFYEVGMWGFNILKPEKSFSLCEYTNADHCPTKRCYQRA